MDEAMDMQAVLQEALRELHTISDRAELQDDCFQIRIDFGPVLEFDSPTWEMIFGSSGTGKTILFKAWEEEVDCAVARPAVLPIYISGKRLRGAPGAQLAEPHDRAEVHFAAFLKQLAEGIEQAASKLNRRDRDKGTSERQLKRRARQTQELLAEIQEAISQGRTIRLPGRTAREEERIVESEDRKQVSTGIRAWLGGAFGVLIRGGATRSRSKAATERDTTRREAQVEPDFDLVRERLSELASTLEVDRFCVLLDEWSAIDTRVQPWLGEWLMHCFGAHRRIVFKIASNRTDTRLRDEQLRIGFRLGEDIDNAGVLDRPRMSEADLAVFFELLLLKRLATKRTDLTDHFVGDRLARPNPEFVNSMFAEYSVFETLVRGTEGNPRTFLRSLHKLISRGFPGDGWTEEEVVEVVGPPQLPTELFEDEISETELTFQYTLRPVVVTTGSRYFLVRAEDRQIASERLEEMLETGLVYPDESAVLPDALRDRFDGYWLSEEGFWLLGRSRLQMQDMAEGSEGPTEGWLNPREPWIETLEQAMPYVLDFDRWR